MPIQPRYLKLTTAPHYRPRITQRKISLWLTQLEKEKKQLLIEPPSPRIELIEISKSAFEEKIKQLRSVLNYEIDYFEITFRNGEQWTKKSASVLRAFDDAIAAMQSEREENQPYYSSDFKQLVHQTIKNLKQSRKRGFRDVDFDITLIQKVAHCLEEYDWFKHDILRMKRIKFKPVSFISDGLTIQFHQELKKALLDYLAQHPTIKVGKKHPAEHLATYEVNGFFPSQAKYYLSLIKEQNHLLALNKIFEAHKKNSKLFSQLTTPEKLKTAKLEMATQAKWWLAAGIFAVMAGTALLAVTLLLHLSIMLGVIGMAAGIMGLGIALIFFHHAQISPFNSLDSKSQTTSTYAMLIKAKKHTPAPSISHEAGNQADPLPDSQYSSQQMFQPKSPDEHKQQPAGLTPALTTK